MLVASSCCFEHNEYKCFNEGPTLLLLFSTCTSCSCILNAVCQHVHVCTSSSLLHTPAGAAVVCVLMHTCVCFILTSTHNPIVCLAYMCVLRPHLHTHSNRSCRCQCTCTYMCVLHPHLHTHSNSVLKCVYSILTSTHYSRGRRCS